MGEMKPFVPRLQARGGRGVRRVCPGRRLESLGLGVQSQPESLGWSTLTSQNLRVLMSKRETTPLRVAGKIQSVDICDTLRLAPSALEVLHGWVSG